MSATFSKVVGNEVHVFVRGLLVMKRWLDTGVSATFHVAPEGVRWNEPKDPGDWPGLDDTDDLRKPCPGCQGFGFLPEVEGFDCERCGGAGQVW